MKVLQRLALLIACLLVAAPLSAQASGTAVSMDVAGGVMRYGPHVQVGMELSTSRIPLAARVDALMTVAPKQEAPGRMFTAAMIGALLPFNANGRVSPYLLGGVALSLSSHLDPAAGGAAGVGARIRIGAFRPFVEGRMQHRTGTTLSFGWRF